MSKLYSSLLSGDEGQKIEESGLLLSFFVLVLVVVVVVLLLLSFSSLLSSFLVVLVLCCCVIAMKLRIYCISCEYRKIRGNFVTLVHFSDFKKVKTILKFK